MRKPSPPATWCAAIVALTTACAPQATESLTARVDDALDDGSAAVDPLLNLYVILEGPSVVAAQPRGTDWSQADVIARTREHLGQLKLQHAAVQLELAAQGATTVAELTKLANAIQVQAPRSSVERLRNIDGVVRVETVPIYRPTLASAVPVTSAPDLWTLSDRLALQGSGISIGIIDSGIDYYHADFGGSGSVEDYESDDSSIIEPGSFPTARVFGGIDFAGDDYNASDPDNEVAQPDDDPLDCVRDESGSPSGGHGTHVAGIAAGNGVTADGDAYAGPYNQSLDLSQFRVAPGMAPDASLYALRVFGCEGSTALLASALEHAADPNDDGVFDDRLDVVNASLGGAYGIESTVNAQLVKNLTEVGSLFVVAAGNEGGTFFVTGSPSTYPQALSVAASADTDFSTLTVDSPESIAADYPGGEGGFNTPLDLSGEISGPVVYAQPNNGCSTITNAAAISGKVALLDRGNCSFLLKFKNLAAAGALAGVVVDDELQSTPIVMGGGDPGEVSLGGLLIRREHGELIKERLADGVTVTLKGDRYEGLGAETFTSFSSRGPSVSGTRLKPEVTAPGASIDSAQVGSGIEPRRSQGTSMACPMVAGAAALLRQASPSLTPLQVKAKLMNAVDPVFSASGQQLPVSFAGGGRIDVARAVPTKAVAHIDSADGSVGVSFGAVTSLEPVTEARTIQLESLSSLESVYQLSVEEVQLQPGVTVSVEPAEIVLPGFGSATATVTLGFDPSSFGAPGPGGLTAATQFDLPRHFLTEVAGRVHLTSADDDLVVPYYAALRAGAERAADTPQVCDGGATGGVAVIPVSGPSAHPAPVTTAFELGYVDVVNPSSGGDDAVARRDLRAVGVASNMATAESFEDVSLIFAVTVEGEWSTPAQGPLSMVSVVIDTDGDTSADYQILARPLNDDDPFADVLVATTYDLATGNQLPTRRYLNLVPASDADTNPFHNSAVVLSVFAHELGLSEDNVAFAYAARSHTAEPGLSGEVTPWIEYDALRPAVDTSRGAPTAGRPLYRAGEPIIAHVDSTRMLEEEPPQMLLIHHANTLRKRWEAVGFTDVIAQQLDFSHELPIEAVRGERVVGKLVVRNDGAHDIAAASVSGTIEGATLSLAAAQGGTCAKSDLIDCNIGVLQPGDVRHVTLILDPDVKASDVVVSVALDTAHGCNIALSATIEMVADTVADPELEVAGGCACRMPVGALRRSSGSGLALLLLGFTLALARVRWRRSE